MPIDSQRTTTPPGEIEVDLRYIQLGNYTDRRYEPEITLSRDGEVVLNRSVVLKPMKTTDDNRVIQGSKTLWGEYLDPVGDYQFEIRVGEQAAVSEVTPERASIPADEIGEIDEDSCYRVQGEIHSSEDDYYLISDTYAGDYYCELAEDIRN